MFVHITSSAQFFVSHIFVSHFFVWANIRPAFIRLYIYSSAQMFVSLIFEYSSTHFFVPLIFVRAFLRPRISSSADKFSSAPFLYRNTQHSTTELTRNFFSNYRKSDFSMNELTLPNLCPSRQPMLSPRSAYIQPIFGTYPTLFKVVFFTEAVCQKIQHVPLVMSITFFNKLLRSLQEING